jgi:hypothetical protein
MVKIILKINPFCVWGKKSYLSKCFSIRTHVSQDNQYVLFTLVSQKLGCGQSQARSNDSFNTERESNSKSFKPK